MDIWIVKRILALFMSHSISDDSDDPAPLIQFLITRFIRKGIARILTNAFPIDSVELVVKLVSLLTVVLRGVRKVANASLLFSKYNGIRFFRHFKNLISSVTSHEQTVFQSIPRNSLKDVLLFSDQLAHWISFLEIEDEESISETHNAFLDVIFGESFQKSSEEISEKTLGIGGFLAGCLAGTLAKAGPISHEGALDSSTIGGKSRVVKEFIDRVFDVRNFGLAGVFVVGGASDVP